MYMTDEQKIWFLYGYIYSQAESLKKNGLFEDMSLSEVMQLIMRSK